MGQFLEDQLNDDKFYYCNGIRYLKENILDIVLRCFQLNDSRKMRIIDLENYVKEQLNVPRINSQAFAKLLNSNHLVDIEFVAKLYKKYSNIEFDISRIGVDKKVLLPKIKTKTNSETEYYYCSKMVRFPLKDVVSAIYNYCQDNNYTYVKLNELYYYLQQKFGVKSFNKSNLSELVGSNALVPFENIKDIYIKVVQSEESNNTYNLELFAYVFIKHRHKFKSCINILGIDYIKDILTRGLTTTINTMNAFQIWMGNEDKLMELNDPSRDKLLNEDDTKVFVELLSSFSENEWLSILDNEADTKELINMFIEDKKVEAEKMSFTNVILHYMSFVDKNNLNARLQYLFPYNVYQIFSKYNMHKVEDINLVTREISCELFEFKDVIVKTIKNLQIDLRNYLNERFAQLVQMVNKDYIPHRLWQNYVSIMEKRADGKTLEQSGEHLGVTRERVRQLDKKYIEHFNMFYNGNGNLNNLIRAYVENPLFISNEDIKRLFPFNSKIFKYLLKSIEVDNLLLIEELDKFYFIDDYDWYKELVVFSENMPSQINQSSIQKYLNNAIEILNNNNITLSDEDIKNILLQDYKQIGSVLSKTHLSIGERFKTVLINHFPNPVNIYDEKFLTAFREKYDDMYHDDKIKSDHAIQSVIARIGMIVGRGTYILNNRMFMSSELADKIYNYIINSGKPIFLTNTIFAIFEDELLLEGINNKYFMQGALKQRYEGKLYFKRDYISTSEDVTNIYGVIYNYVKDAKRLVSFDELQEEFKGSPWNVIIMAILQDGILNYRTKYISVDALDINESDKEYLQEVISRLISDSKIHHTNDLLAYVRMTNSKLLEKLYIQDQFALFSVIDYLFGEEFELKRPFIAQKGIVIENQNERIKEFVHSQDILTIDELTEFTSTNKLHLYSISEFVDSLEDYVFKNESEIISIDKANINKYSTEVVERLILKELGNNEFIFADKLQLVHLYPKGINWTPWLIYSAINKFGKELKAIPSSTKFKVKNTVYARPLIIRKDVKANNINEYMEYLKTKLQLDDTEFYKYLRVKGLL